jgi:hypothetical protein
LRPETLHLGLCKPTWQDLGIDGVESEHPARLQSRSKEFRGDEEGRMTTVWIYVDAGKQVGDLDHLKVFVDEATADTWLAENDPEGMAFEYEVLQ